VKQKYLQKALRILILLIVSVGQLFYFELNPKTRYLINLNLVKEEKFNNSTEDNGSEFVSVNKTDDIVKASENISLTINLIYTINSSQKYLLHELELLAILHNNHSILLHIIELEKSIPRAPPFIIS